MVATPIRISKNLQTSARQYLIDAISPNQSLLPLTAKVNDRDHLEIGGCDVVDLAKQFGTSLYIVDEQTLDRKSVV